MTHTHEPRDPVPSRSERFNADDVARRHQALIERDEVIGRAAATSLSRASLDAQEQHLNQLFTSTSWRVGRALVLPASRLRALFRRKG